MTAFASSFANQDGSFFNEGGNLLVVDNPASGSTIALKWSQRALHVANASALAALTVMLPKTASPGDLVGVSFQSAVVALTMKDGFGNAIAGAPSFAGAGALLVFRRLSKAAGWFVCAPFGFAGGAGQNGSMLFQAGRFYSSDMICGVASGGVPTIGSLTAGTPVYVPNAVVLQTLSVESAGTISGTLHARAALYTDSGGGPGSPVTGADTGDLTQTVAGVLTSGALGAVLSPGWYWPVFETSALASGTMFYASGARAGSNGGANSADGAVRVAHVYLMTHTYGAALPTWATSSETTAANMPIVVLGT